MNTNEFDDIIESVKICPHITEFERLKNDGHPDNRVITCREDKRADVLPEDEVLSIFIPGYAITLCTDGTWYASPDGDN